MTSPAHFDFQVNGFAGIDLQGNDLTAGALRSAVDGLRADGVGGIYLTLITDHEASLCARFERLGQFLGIPLDAARDLWSRAPLAAFGVTLAAPAESAIR